MKTGYGSYCRVLAREVSADTFPFRGGFPVSPDGVACVLADCGHGRVGLATLSLPSFSLHMGLALGMVPASELSRGIQVHGQGGPVAGPISQLVFVEWFSSLSPKGGRECGTCLRAPLAGFGSPVSRPRAAPLPTSQHSPSLSLWGS